jgi:hypothetical protein
MAGKSSGILALLCVAVLATMATVAVAELDPSWQDTEVTTK